MSDPKTQLPTQPTSVSHADLLRQVQKNKVGTIPTVPDTGCINVDETVSEEQLNHFRFIGSLTVDDDVTEKLLRSVMNNV